MISHRYVFSLLTVSAFAATGRRPRFEPLPPCSECVSVEDIQAPGIGIDLTTSYATAAIRYYNGSLVDLGKVSLQHFARSPVAGSSELPPVLSTDSAWDQLQCSIAHAKRRFNKLRGVPATTDVGIIANLTSQLRVTINNKLGSNSIERVFVVVPRLPGLFWEDVSDALEYSGLSGIISNKHMGGLVSEISASFAGMGYGLCEHYDDPDTCEDEEAEMPYSHILELSLSRVSFDAAYTYMQSAWRSDIENQRFRFDLGLDNLPHDQYDREVYWENIRKTIVEIGKASHRPLTHVLMLGDVVDNHEYIRTVQDALMELIPHELTRESIMPFAKNHQSLNSLYVAARGAAEFAKRMQEAPRGCKESPQCRGNRHPQSMHTDMKDQAILNEEL
ncbi:hypothetical protein B0O99DRAFT_706830 [Bisporella sp. PMI_857]|nr:hypothetical protein B0O99DRAFT_706830 [Bisporella sp. PMI_857]